jgi:hypothetical protein
MTLPKYLYHGTSSRFLSSIMKEGLKPRGRRQGNWKNMPSGNNRVYLTNAYAPYFAAAACSKNEKALVLKIDTEVMTNLFVADEDAMAAVASDIPGDTLVAKTKWAREHAIQLAAQGIFDAEASLNVLGVCAAIGNIPATAIKAAVEMTPSKALMNWDASIVPMNYRFCGPGYKDALEKLFDTNSEIHHKLVENTQEF